MGGSAVDFQTDPKHGSDGVMSHSPQIIDLASEKTFLWHQSNWLKPLEDFARASGITVALYDANGQRQLGPITHHPLMRLLEENGAWNEGGLCHETEKVLVNSCLEKDIAMGSVFENTLSLAGLPFRFRGMPAGVIVYGWVFDQFADPVRCAKLARLFELPENLFWTTARGVAPMSRERLRTFASLLETLVHSTLAQMSTVLDVKATERFKDQFLATVSHELKTPLTSMVLRIQLLKRAGLVTKESLDRSIEVLERSAAMQVKLVDDLLESSRVATGKLRLEVAKLNPIEMIQQAIDAIMPHAETKNLQVSFVPVPLRYTYRGDPARLQQVLWNLLNNALKFTPEGGFIAVSAVEKNRRLRVEVTDSGAGIDPSLVSYIFDPFYQVPGMTDSSNKGLGLGLSIAKSIVELHGGSIEVKSLGRGRGSTFSFEIPAAE
jgi:signal transduction histidine kinase